MENTEKLKQKIMIPSAEEILKHNESNAYYDQNSEYRIKSMIEFAKLHVTEALKQASENAESYIQGESMVIDKDSILNAYPLENIK